MHDNDGKFPDESPVEIRYPRSKQEEQGDREQWPWLPGTIVGQCGPDEWYVCIEVVELTVLQDGRRASRVTASRNLYYPCCFRDGSEIRQRTASNDAASAMGRGARGRPHPGCLARTRRVTAGTRSAVRRAVGTAAARIDCQGLFCETDKYCREAAPELASARKRIKARFTPTPEPIRLFFPPRWGTNNELPSQPVLSDASQPSMSRRPCSDRLFCVNVLSAGRHSRRTPASRPARS